MSQTTFFVLSKGSDEILTKEALAFVAELHRNFNPRRIELLNRRAERQVRIDAGELPDFLPETKVNILLPHDTTANRFPLLGH